jgi:DNA polymerase delta subunit 1
MQSKAVIRMFGVTEEGNSVLAYVNNFKPYFYIPAPPGFTQEDCQPLLNSLSSEISAESVSVVHKKPLLGYKGDIAPLFIKITFPDPKLIPRARDRFLTPLKRVTMLTRIFLFTILRKGLMSL